MSLTDMVIMPGADYQAACDAIREKTEGVGYIRSGDMAEMIRNIETGTQLPELTNPAGAGDIASGKEVVDGEGNRLTGTLRDGGNLSMQATAIEPAMWAVGGNPTMVDTILRCTFDMENAICRKGETVIEMRAGNGVFGDATAEDVAAGKTFTSTAGLKVTGTAESGARTVSVTIDSAATQYGYDIYAQYVDTSGEIAYQVIPAKTKGTAMTVPVLGGMVLVFMGASAAPPLGYDGRGPKEVPCKFTMAAGDMPAKIIYQSGDVILKPMVF